MPRTSVQGYLESEIAEMFEYLRQYYQERDPAIKLSDSGLISKLIADTYHKVIGGQSNTNRITTIVESQAKVEQAVTANTDGLAVNTHKLGEFTGEITEIKELIRQLIERSPK